MVKFKQGDIVIHKITKEAWVVISTDVGMMKHLGYDIYCRNKNYCTLHFNSNEFTQEDKK